MQPSVAIRTVISQIQFLLAQLDPRCYAQPLAVFDGSTLGQHFRHILEFFQCVHSGSQSGIVDYASRPRNLLFQDSPGAASAAFEEFGNTLDSLDFQQVIQVVAELGLANRPTFGSTIGRELTFVYDHAIHHLALIKIGLVNSFPEIEIDQNLGVSPSTLKFRSVAS